MRSAAVVLKAQFYDVDLMEVVWHGNYTRFLEQARCALLDQIDYNYASMRASGYAWPIVDLRIKFVRPIRFGQEFSVEATIAEYTNGLKIDYVIRDPVSGEALTRARTFQVPVDIATGELSLESPPILIEKLAARS